MPLRTPVGADPCVWYELQTVSGGVGIESQMGQRAPLRLTHSANAELVDGSGSCALLLAHVETVTRSTRAGVVMPEDGAGLGGTGQTGAAHLAQRGQAHHERDRGDGHRAHDAQLPVLTLVFPYPMPALT